MPDLNEEVTYEIDDAQAVSIPIDTTLTHQGEAAEAYAVGQALAGKMDAGYRVSVNGVDADNQGEILINGEDIPLTDATGSPTVAAAVAALDAKDGSSILTGESGSSETILEAIERLDGEIETVGTFDTTLAEAGKGADAYTVGTRLQEVMQVADAAVKTVDGNAPDAVGNVALNGFVRSIEGITPGSGGDLDLGGLLATVGEINTAVQDVLSGSMQSQERDDVVSHYRLRAALMQYHDALPSYFVKRKVVNVTIPAGMMAYTLSDAWITTETDCYAHTLEAQDVPVSVRWEFSQGYVNFYLGAAMQGPLSFVFGMIKGGTL